MNKFIIDQYLSRQFAKADMGDFFISVCNFLSASESNREFKSYDVSFIEVWPVIKSACEYLDIDPKTCCLIPYFEIIDPEPHDLPTVQNELIIKDDALIHAVKNTQPTVPPGPKFLHMVGRPSWQRTAITAWCWYHHRDRIKISYQPSEEQKEQQGLDGFWRGSRTNNEWKEIFTAWVNRDEETIDDIRDLQNINDLYDSNFHYGSALPYTDTCLEIVCETVTENEYCLSEKVIRPILRGRPFVVLAAPKYLEWLRNKGFDTFNHLWSELYDQGEHWTRIEETCDTINNILTNLSYQEIWDKTRRQCDHNIEILKKLVLEN